MKTQAAPNILFITLVNHKWELRLKDMFLLHATYGEVVVRSVYSEVVVYTVNW